MAIVNNQLKTTTSATINNPSITHHSHLSNHSPSLMIPLFIPRLKIINRKPEKTKSIDIFSRRKEEFGIKKSIMLVGKKLLKVDAE